MNGFGFITTEIFQEIPGLFIPPPKTEQERDGSCGEHPQLRATERARAKLGASEPL
ncbi:MAG: hypothetical protein Q8P67_24770 [archaeon]|nr:hypothetical protein [archaeon]